MVGTGLIRGSAISASGSAAGSTWGGSGGWGGTADAGCIYFSFTTNSGYKVSLTSLTCSLRRSGTGPGSGNIEYSLNGGAYVVAGPWVTSSTSSPGQANNIPMSAINALQNIAAGTVVKIRFTYSATG